MIYQSDILTVNDAIAAIRQSFDSIARREKEEVRAEIEPAYLKFESVRYRFAHRLMQVRRSGHVQAAGVVISELRHALIDLSYDKEFWQIASQIRITRVVRPRNSPFHDDIRLLSEIGRGMPVSTAIGILVEVLNGGVEWNEDIDREVFAANEAERDANTLRKLVPEQKIAPVQFEVEGGQLHIRQQAHSPLPGREAVVDAAAGELVRRGEDLANQLRNSNCDPRLLNNVEELQEHLKTGQNAIQIGISNLACEQLAKAFYVELPDALAALLVAHTSSVSMYLSQFSEWRDFSESAEIARVTEFDVSSISQILSDVVNDLEQDPQISDPEVPKVLRALREFLDDPKKSSKKVALAAVRTIENLVIRVFGYGADFIDKTIHKTIDRSSGVVAIALAGALISVALTAAGGLGVLAPGIEGLGWMQDAMSIVVRQLQLLQQGAGG
ncbi:hypothetical protein [Devosia sp.]|uniref:hypothetical protein n=1 Tax=Devosia sp. TaxID=1871048 RepID=UPI003A93BE26